LREELVRWHSGHLGKDTEMLVIGHAGKPVLLFPTSMGRYFQNKDFGLTKSAQWFVEQGLFKLYCVDGIDLDSWYNKEIHPAHRIHNHMLYDRMLHEEIVPGILNETGHSRVIVGGCSFGGYHAMNYGFRHPERVEAVISMGGSFDIKPQLSGYYDDNAYFNNPVDFIPNANDPNLWNMRTILGTSEHDFCKGANENMAQVLRQKSLPVWLDVLPMYNHDWPAWCEMFPKYLSTLV
jgi:esterase/lipase superfamily enzyme